MQLPRTVIRIHKLEDDQTTTWAQRVERETAPGIIQTTVVFGASKQPWTPDTLTDGRLVVTVEQAFTLLEMVGELLAKVQRVKEV